MTGYGFFSSLRMIFGLALVVLVSLLAFAGFIYSELSTEARFRSTYGVNWRTEYEHVYGPLTTAHAKISASAVGIVAVSALVVWLWRLLRRVEHSRHSGRRKRKDHRSRIERATSYRRSALLGIYFGLVGIAMGVFLVIFRAGIFWDHSNEVVLGLFVFLASYTGVIAGCSYWLKAKGWNEAVVFIGLMPLVILLIPFVRLIFTAAPAILPCGMVMMPLILIVVVAVLPDKSGTSKRRSRWDLTRAGWHRNESANIDDTDAGRPKTPLQP